jgi:hypothetical protein
MKGEKAWLEPWVRNKILKYPKHTKKLEIFSLRGFK